MDSTRKALSPITRFNVWRRDGFRCTYCNRSALEEHIALTVDHVIPLVNGGSDDMDNLTTACQRCNYQKGARLSPLLTGRVPVGIELNRPQREQADRLKAVMGGTRSAVLRAAIDLGLAELERRHPEAANDANGEAA